MDQKQILWLLFGISGRVSRAAYFLAGLLLAVIQTFLLYRFTLAVEDSGASQFWAMAFWVAVLASLWANFSLSVKRLHDFGKPGIIAVALFVPVLSIIAFIALCLVPGDPGPNQYGERSNAPK